MPRKGERPAEWQVLITPAQASALCAGHPGPDRIREWCASGRIAAIDSGSGGRPEWLIEPEQFRRDVARIGREESAARRHPAADVIDMQRSKRNA